MTTFFGFEKGEKVIIFVKMSEYEKNLIRVEGILKNIYNPWISIEEADVFMDEVNYRLRNVTISIMSDSVIMIARKEPVEEKEDIATGLGSLFG